MSEYYTVNRSHLLEPSLLIVWDHVIPISPVLLESLKNHLYCKTKTLSQNPECLVACFSIIGNLVELKDVEVEDPVLRELGERISDTTQEFKSFQSSDNYGAHECGVLPSFYTKAKKALIELGLIKVHFKNKPILDSQGKKTFSNPKGSTYTATPKLKKHFFRHTPKKHSIPVDFIPTNLPEATTPKTKQRVSKSDGKSNPTQPSKKEKEKEKEKRPPFKNERKFIFTASKKIYLPANGMKQEVFDMAKKLYGLKPNNRNQIIRGVFIFIDLLQNRYRGDPDDFLGLFTDQDGYGFIEIQKYEHYEFTQKFLKSAFSNGTDGHPETVNRVKNIILSPHTTNTGKKLYQNGLSWMKMVKNYQKKVSGYTFQFTQKFYHGSADPLGCDEDEAYEITNQKLQAKFKVLSLCSLTKKALTPEFFEAVDNTRKWKTIEKRKWRNALHNFDYNKGWSNQARKGGRMTTSIVGLPREFRDQILIDGKPTVEIDIQSAHSLFIAHTDEFKQFKTARKEWIKLVSSGDDIYMKLAKMAEDAGGTLPDINDYSSKKERNKAVRKIFKKFLNAYLNGGGQKAFNKVHKLGIQFKKHMKEWFPELHQVIQLLLERYTDERSTDIPQWEIKRNGAAIRLQQIESEIMGTHWMCNGDIPCVSIHDGLLCKVTDADRLIKAVKKRAEKILGFQIVVERK
jgi:hypothetical protein